MKFVELKKSLKESILPCYVLNGNDVFLLYKSLELIKNATVQTFPEFNEVVFGENASYQISEIVEACLSLPLGDDKRLIVVRDCNLKPTDDNLKTLAGYLKQPNESACLVFFNSVANEFCAKIKGCEVVDCNKLSNDIVLKLIFQKCRECGKAINSDACSLLSLYCLGNLARIYNEIEKLVCFVGDENLITIKDVETNVMKELEFEGYEFAQAVAAKNTNRAFEILNELLAKKEGVGFVIASLYNQFSKLFFVSVSKMEVGEIAQLLGIKEFAVKKSKELASNFTKRKLKNIVELISQKEFEMKSGKISQNNICENLLNSIMNCV